MTYDIVACLSSAIVVIAVHSLFNKYFRKPAIVIDTDTTNNNNNNNSNNNNKIDDILSTHEKKVVVESPTPINTVSSHKKHRRNKSDVPTAMLGGGGTEDDVFGMNSSSTHNIQSSNSGNSPHRRIHSEMPPQRRSQSGYLTDKVQDFPDLIDSNLEPHYSNLIDSANAPIFGVDSVGRVNVWNQCAMRIVGYTKDEVMGKILGVWVWCFLFANVLLATSSHSIYFAVHLVTEFITKDYQASVGMVIDRALRQVGHLLFVFLKPHVYIKHKSLPPFPRCLLSSYTFHGIELNQHRGDETANYEFPLMTKEGAR